MYDFIAGSDGIQLQVGVNVYLADIAVTLSVQGVGGTPQDASLDMTVGTESAVINGVAYGVGYWVYRNLVATDFPIAGRYLGQVVPATVFPASDPFEINVGPLLGGYVAG